MKCTIAVAAVAAALSFAMLPAFGEMPEKELAAEAKDKEFIENTAEKLQDRTRRLTDALHRRNRQKQSQDRIGLNDYAKAFVSSNRNEIGGGASSLYSLMLAIEKNSGAHDLAEKSALFLLQEEGMHPNHRIDGALYLGDRAFGNNDLSKADGFYRKALPFVQKNAYYIALVHGRLARSAMLKNDLDGALDIYAKSYEYNNSADMTNRVVEMSGKALESLYRFEDAIKFYEKHGRMIYAARLANSANYSDRSLAERIYRSILENKDANINDRREAYRFLFPIDANLGEKYFSDFVSGNQHTTNQAGQFFASKIGGNAGSFAYFGNYGQVVRYYEYYRRISDDLTWMPHSFQTAQYALIGYWIKGDRKKAVEVCNYAIANDANLKPEEIYQLSFTAGLLTLKGSDSKILKGIRKLDESYKGDLPAKTRVSRIERAGSAAMIANEENLVRLLDEYVKSLYVQRPVRSYTVKYSGKPISGLSAWDSIEPKPEVQLMDRNYGGNMDFLVTDVATGNRGENINATEGAKRKVPPMLQMAFDDNGIHFRFEAFDEKSKEIAAGFAGGGSYEGYIAPGENRPYICTLFDLAPDARLSLYNTTYTTEGHRRIRTKEDMNFYRTETAFTDNSVVSYFMLSWKAFTDVIPDNGTKWDFENILWGREGSAAWNGTESIHGRSTWGEIVFDMPQKARIEILKRCIFAAAKHYRDQKRTSHHGEGVIDHWKDESVGDAKFFELCVKPFVERLDSYLSLVRTDMTDEDVLKVSREALHDWFNIEFIIGRMRSEYLKKGLFE